MRTLEWWPDHGRTPLWSAADGRQVDLEALTLGSDLTARLRTWGDAYEEDKLPIDGAGDTAWLQDGVELLAAVRQALAGRYLVVVTEPWWGENP